MRIEAESQVATNPAHIEQIMKSGFSMSDIKGLQRNYAEDAVEADEVVGKKKTPGRPPRKGSIPRAQFEGDSMY